MEDMGSFGDVGISQDVDIRRMCRLKWRVYVKKEAKYKRLQKNGNYCRLNRFRFENSIITMQ